jgi:opacity protein-like surface antigen
MSRVRGETMKTLVLGIFVLAVSVSLVGCNVTPTEFSEPGLYVGGALKYGFEDFDDLDPDESNDGDESVGLGVRAGYRIAPWIGAELEYEYFDDYDVAVADVNVQSLMLQGKAYPFTGRLQPYALGGIGMVSSDLDFDESSLDETFDETEFAWRLGAGLDFYLIEFLPLFVELAYTWPTNDLDELQYWTGAIGAYFRF